MRTKSVLFCTPFDGEGSILYVDFLEEENLQNLMNFVQQVDERININNLTYSRFSEYSVSPVSRRLSSIKTSNTVDTLASTRQVD